MVGQHQVAQRQRLARQLLRTGFRVLSSLFCKLRVSSQLKSTVVCESCKNVSTTFDPFYDLSLPIPKVITHVLTLRADLLLCRARRNRATDPAPATRARAIRIHPGDQLLFCSVLTPRLQQQLLPELDVGR